MSIPRLPVPWRTPVATSQPNLVEVLHFTDAACPWAYNFEPTLRALEARYGDQLHVRTVMIGLSESYEDYVKRGYSAEGSSLSRRRFRRRGMPMATGPRSRPFGTAPACRLVKAAELQGVPQAEAVLRALRFGWFTTDLVMDDPETLRMVAESIDGLDAERALADWATPGGRAGLPERPRRGPRRRRASRSRSAAPPPATGPTATPRRASCCGQKGASSIAPGYQPFEAVDVLVMNLVPQAERLPVPSLDALLAAYPGGLTTAEVARVLADTTNEPDLAEAEDELIRLAVAGGAKRRPLGHDALWTAA